MLKVALNTITITLYVEISVPTPELSLIRLYKTVISTMSDCNIKIIMLNVPNPIKNTEVHFILNYIIWEDLNVKSKWRMIDFVTEEIVDLVFDHVYPDRKCWGEARIFPIQNKAHVCA
jgi:hypothetical protein